jgi:type I restriction enzyme S subunit
VSLPRYSEYKDSGVEWLGAVPAHWTLEKLRYLAEFSGGGTPSREIPSYWHGPIPWVSPKDMKQECIAGTEESITEAGLQSSASSLVSTGQVLMVVRSGILKHTIPVAINTIQVALNQDMKALKFRDGIGAFFVRWVQGLNDHLLLVWAKQGATVESIEHGYLAETVLPLPPVHERLAITRFLDRELTKIDALIAEQRHLIELLKGKRRAVIAHAATKGMNPDTPMKQSGVDWLGEVPNHWKVIRLGSIFDEVSEPGTDLLPVLSVSIHHGVSDKELNEDELDRKVSRSDDRSKYKRVGPGDLVYNMMRAWQGGFGTVKVEGMVSPAYVVARPRAYLVTDFIEHLLRTPRAVEQMRRQSRGVTDFRLRLYWDEFKNIRIALPPASEATAICEKIESMDKEFEAVTRASEESISLLRERRTALISAAVTGKINVGEAAHSA